MRPCCSASLAGGARAPRLRRGPSRARARLRERPRLLRRHRLLDRVGDAAVRGPRAAAVGPADGSCSRPTSRSTRRSSRSSSSACRAAFGRSALWLAPAVWVTTELGRGHVLDRLSLGAARLQPGDACCPSRRLASVFGVYGLSLLVALVSSRGCPRRPADIGAAGRGGGIGGGDASDVVLGGGRSRLRCVRGGHGGMGTASACANTLTGGHARPRRAHPGQHPAGAEVGPGQSRADPRTYLDMSRTRRHAGRTFIIWPESSTPFFFEDDPAHGDQVRQLAYQTRSWVLFGSDQIEPGPAAALLQLGVPARARPAHVAAVYRRCTSCPFGEYVPLKTLLFFVGAAGASPSRISRRARRCRAMPVARTGWSARPSATRWCTRTSSRQAVERRQPAADDDHQRRLVRPVVGAVAALRAGVAARDRAGALSGALRQHRHQRHRRSVRPRRRAIALFEQTSSSARCASSTDRTVYSRIGDAFAYACAVTLAAGRDTHGTT